MNCYNNAKLTIVDFYGATIIFLLFEIFAGKIGFDLITPIFFGGAWLLQIFFALICIKIINWTSLKNWIILLILNLITLIVWIIRVVNLK